MAAEDWIMFWMWLKTKSLRLEQQNQDMKRRIQLTEEENRDLKKRVEFTEDRLAELEKLIRETVE